MTTRREPDVILAAWLDENAVPLPSQTRHAIETSIRTIPQRRRPMWMPWRSFDMPTPLRLAATAAIVVVIAVGALLYFRPTDLPGVGAPSPSPSASAVASGIDPSTWTEHVSEDGYTVKHPADWRPWPEEGRTFFAGGADWGTGITVGRYPMADASTPAEWLEATCGRAFAFAGEKPDPADGLVACELIDGAEWAETTVDGHEAVDGYSADNCCRDTAVFVGDQVYLITGWHNVAYDPALYDAFIEHVTLQP